MLSEAWQYRINLAALRNVDQERPATVGPKEDHYLPSDYSLPTSIAG
jgi:hypothetical protein